MNIFLKNNKIIMCILYIWLLTTPAYAAIGRALPPDAGIADQLNAVQASYFLLRSALPGHGKRKHAFNGAVRSIYLLARRVDGTNPQGTISIAMMTGLYFIPDLGVLFVNGARAKKFFSISKAYMNGAFNALGMPLAPPTLRGTAVARTAPCIKTDLTTFKRAWTLRMIRPGLGQQERAPLAIPHLVVPDAVDAGPVAGLDLDAQVQGSMSIPATDGTLTGSFGDNPPSPEQAPLGAGNVIPFPYIYHSYPPYDPDGDGGGLRNEQAPRAGANDFAFPYIPHDDSSSESSEDGRELPADYRE
ncbi:MAG: hypothetical protein NkDv07_0763 [Candidatus Improbicoccus devescovinae]|nr:MAG: hypothetical protein NkDv07_0763 [Candidatus Improbicoccus devescovinae]